MRDLLLEVCCQGRLRLLSSLRRSTEHLRTSSTLDLAGNGAIRVEPILVTLSRDLGRATVLGLTRLLLLLLLLLLRQVMRGQDVLGQLERRLLGCLGNGRMLLHQHRILR